MSAQTRTRRDAREEAEILTAREGVAAIRWQPGERLEQLFESRCDELLEQGNADALAVDGPAGRLTYAELEESANRLARHLHDQHGVLADDRIGLLFDDAAHGYVGMLAVLKLHAAYVPIDAGSPSDRLTYIAEDAGLKVILSEGPVADRFTELEEAAKVLRVDELANAIAAESEERLGPDEIEEPRADLAYVIYTSGTTGRPKGVTVGHPSICNFVRVASEVYGIERSDRVYQGLTMAFDFSFEEIWVAWMAGATLVPRPGGGNLIGIELQEFLSEQKITALCCVPTLLATLEDDLPDLRFLLVSGESCPQDLVERWSRPGRRFLNTYGPTEATVSATWTLLDPGRPVTIGVPLPTYSVVILNPDEDRALALDQTGEIGIAGIGLADGYLNDPDRTTRAFVSDFLSIPDNPSGRIYRTGDLGRVNSGGEIELHGRIDAQIKIRGYRVEPGEIEAVLRQVPGVERAVVSTCEPAPGVEELVAFYRQAAGSPAVDNERAYALLRDRLPSYMVPAYLEQLDELPLMVSGKVDRSKLPELSVGRRNGRADAYVGPTSDVESALADQLASTLGVERVSVEGHFFDDLGASSLLMARFNAELRKRGDLPLVSIRDVYLHPTIRRLAAAVAEPDLQPTAVPEFSAPELPAPTGTPRYFLCGALQLLTFIVYAGIAGLAFDAFASWLATAHGLLDLYARAFVFGAATILGAGMLPILAKWLLIGRWKPRRISVWSVTYVRFWIVKTLVRSNPLARLLVGTPLFGLYLRALGAKVGRGTLILTHHVPVCTDLLAIGSDTVIRDQTYLNGYRATAGVIEIGAITIGDDAFVGEKSVIDIGTTIEDGAQLGHASGLLAGQSVPAGECWHGSPAEPAPQDDYQTVAPASCGPLRRAIYSLLRLTSILVIVGPLEALVVTALVTHPGILPDISIGDTPLIAAGIVVGLLLTGLIVVSTVPRLLSRALKPGRVYPLYGVHHTIQRIVARTSNFPLMTQLFGDSSAITGYLRLLGYRLGVVEQTGTNFGVDVKHVVPGLCEVGTGTMVSDPLSMMNAEFSSSSFRIMPVAIGERNYMGNDIVFPAGASVGDNCLLATKAMMPTSGPLREGVGLLGSPPFEIPRSVPAPEELRKLGSGSERQRGLAGKNRHNAVTAVLFLLLTFVFTSATVLIALAPLGGGTTWVGVAATTASVVLDLIVLPAALFILAERILTAWQPLRPMVVSIYQPEFWRHERYWKVSSLVHPRVFDGTPFKNLVWRALGVRMGRRVFDDGCGDGCGMVERSLVSLGDEATLNMGCFLQCHSLEEGIFKSDRITIGSGCTVGTGAFVHYDVEMEDGSLLEADSFLMKGSRVTAAARWRGNPATEVAVERDPVAPEPKISRPLEVQAT